MRGNLLPVKYVEYIRISSYEVKERLHSEQEAPKLFRTPSIHIE